MRTVIYRARTHLELLRIAVLLPDQVHGRELLVALLEPLRVVAAGDLGDGVVLGVALHLAGEELLHVLGVVVRDGDVWAPSA